MQANHPIACAFVDVDNFKSINDKYGHQVGDEVLCGIARLLMLGVRDNDPCVRYGGEEIMMFLPGRPELGAGRRRRAHPPHDRWPRLGAHRRGTPGDRVVRRERARQGRRPEELALPRDQAMLAAKRAGRNRVLRASTLRDEPPLAVRRRPLIRTDAASPT
jgi:GGDEF domain-containing protein